MDAGDGYLDLHPPALLVSPDGVDMVRSSGPILGWMRGLSYPDTRLRLRPGDTLVLYTDGITDARRGGQLVGVDGLRAELTSAGATSRRRLPAR